MDFFVNFKLDEEFNETIKSRFRDDFSYASFSEGEKMRIDLALLFTWRAIAKMKNSVSTNLLILDEIFDSSLDVNGTDDFLKIINTLQDENVFIISHKTDILIDKFKNIIQVEKHKNFTRII
jgi:energy-coupling factor transporter ATP-binding protein EcfA2